MPPPRAPVDAIATPGHDQPPAYEASMVELAFANAPIGMALIATDGRWLKVNAALCAITGRDEATLLAGSTQDVTHPDDLPTEAASAAELFDGVRDAVRLEKRYLRPDGCVVWVLIAATLVRHDDGRPHFFVAQMEDISERKATETRLRHEATHDPLTGLWNRARVHEELRRCIDECERYGRPASLLLVDLDGFKDVNDTHGHEAGDRHLRSVAEALRGSIRTSDRCARLGGDEFAVLLIDLPAVEVLEVANRVVSAVRACSANGSTRASVGVAHLVPGSEQQLSAEGWLRAADQAMYAAKRAGGDRHLLLDE